jgi:hypothetical protein
MVLRFWVLGYFFLERYIKKNIDLYEPRIQIKLPVLNQLTNINIMNDSTLVNICAAPVDISSTVVSGTVADLDG